MKSSNSISDLQFHQKLQYHSTTLLLPHSQPLPLYKLLIRPYDYYIQYSFTSTISKLQFYQELHSYSTLIIPPEHISIQEIEGSYFDKWFGLAEKNIFSICCFFKYYNYTIGHWIDHQKKCNSIISQEEILMIFRQLLSFQKNYYQSYRQDCRVFKTDLIFITPEKYLRIYPQSIEFIGQISVRRESQTYLNLSMAKLDKQPSLETTISNSRAQIQVTAENEHDESCLSADLRDIFILILQLISLKKYEYFYSQKHSMIVWDSVNNILDSISTSHLSHSFINLLKKCASLKEFNTDWLLPEVEKIISEKQRMCKTIRIEKNQQLADLISKRVQIQKNKRLEQLKVLANGESKRKLNSFHSL